MLIFRTLTLTITLAFSSLPRPILNHCFFRQISSKFPPLTKMGKINESTKSSQAERLCDGGNFDIDKDSVMADGPLVDTSHDNEEYTMAGSVIPDWRSFDTSHDNEKCMMVGSIPIIQLVPQCKNMQNHSLPLSTRCNSSTDSHPECMSMPDHLPSPPIPPVSEHTKFNSRTRIGDNGEESSFSFSYENNSLSLTKTLPATNFVRHLDESCQRKKRAASVNRRHTSHSNLKYTAAGHNLDSSVSLAKFKPYDICLHRKRNSALIGSSWFEKNEESCIEMQEGGTKDMILRPGMVLLKHYINHNEQVDIVKICRKLGLGPGGFYQPGYADGAKLRLLMMCLGLDWDPQTRKYGNKRSIDGSKPPSIPHRFSLLVIRAIQEAHSLISKEYGVSNVEDILPSISPDVCIINFYRTNGRLGLHQDRDESRESLQKGLPVVSFSIGDSAEFLYGDRRDVERAENALLESGDVLIFGGESRHVFHGVSSIIPNSAPKELLKDTCLRPGRLNLTFRQY